MPVTLAKLTANRAHARIDCGDGDVLAVEYYPSRLTSAMLQQFLAADKLADLDATEGVAVLGSVTDMLLTLLASWDLLDAKRRVLPITRENLEALGLIWQWRILQGLMQSSGAGTPGEATAPKSSSADFGAISSQKDS
jgi:hypothetical protein